MRFEWLWPLLGKDAAASIVYFASGSEPRVRAMVQEISTLEPQRPFVVVCLGQPLSGLHCLTLQPAGLLSLWRQLKRGLGRRRIGLAPFLLGSTPHPLRKLAMLAAPRRLLAFNERGERHHLRPSTGIASLLFWRGVELDRIWLRPAWFPWARERSSPATLLAAMEGKPRAGKPAIGLVSPYFPWPLSHGGAVRIYHLLREASRDFDVYLYCFAEAEQVRDTQPVLDLVHRLSLFRQARYREPRWASLLPPEVKEHLSKDLSALLTADRRRHNFLLIQAEYTALAPYTRDVLVEHDVTFDLYQQIHSRNGGISAWWNLYRWRRFEQGATRRMRRVVVMSAKDAAMLPEASTCVIPNGVDLKRFVPSEEAERRRLLFVGSFRHFPNVTAFRFLHEEIWPLVKSNCPDAELEIVAGPDYTRYFPESPASGEGLAMHGFVADVVPLYRRATLVLAPTLVSAGTNLKVLEAMAMCRALVTTSSGCAGIGLRHGESAWIADTAADFADGIVRLLNNKEERTRLAAAARRIAEESFDWQAIGRAQRDLWREWEV